MMNIKTIAQFNAEAINSINAYLVNCQFIPSDALPLSIADKACDAICHLGSMAATLVNYGYLGPEDIGDLDKISTAIFRVIGRCIESRKENVA